MDLLKKGKLTIKEVAKEVGYQDAYHFSKSFKKQYGFAPSMIDPDTEATPVEPKP